METARRMSGDEYEIVVTTHLNTDNLHNHFVVNLVSFKTGRKFENHIRDHIHLREISDYKVHKVVYHPKEEHQVIPNMQEAIVSEEVWLRVQELRQNRIRPTATGRKSLFSGLVYCLDCGAKLHFCAAKSLKRNQEFFRCANYKDGRGNCKIHYIHDIVLEKIVLEAINDLVDFVRCYEPVFLYMLAKKNNAMRQVEMKKLKQTVENGKRRIMELDKLIEKVYEDNALGRLSDERYSKIRNKEI